MWKVQPAGRVHPYGSSFTEIILHLHRTASTRILSAAISRWGALARPRAAAHITPSSRGSVLRLVQGSLQRHRISMIDSSSLRGVLEWGTAGECQSRMPAPLVSVRRCLSHIVQAPSVAERVVVISVASEMFHPATHLDHRRRRRGPREEVSSNLIR